MTGAGKAAASPTRIRVRTNTGFSEYDRHQLLVHEADVSHLPAPLVALVQRLPSVFQLREPVDPADCLVPSGGFCNDAGDCYFRPMGERLEGELSLASASRARQQEALFQRIWERSRNCDAVRVLGV